MRTKSDANKRNNTRTPRPPPSNIKIIVVLENFSSGMSLGRLSLDVARREKVSHFFILYVTLLCDAVLSSSSSCFGFLDFETLGRQTTRRGKRELIRGFESSERYFSSQLTPVLSLSLFLFQYHITSQIILSRSFKTKRNVPFKKRENRNDQRPDATDDG